MDITTIKNFMISFGITGPSFAGISNLFQVLQKLSFTSITSAIVKEGSYIPNNDYLWLWQNIPVNQSPNFIFIQTPTALNITVTSPGLGAIVNAVPANKVFMLCLPPGFIVDNIYIEGRALGPMPMPLGVEVDYYCLMAQAVF